MNRIASTVCVAGLAGLVALPTFADQQKSDREDSPLSYSIDVEGFLPPVFTKQVEPFYGARMRRAGLEGKVVVKGQIDAEGRVSDVVVVEGNPKLARSARKAVEKWQFEPAQASGRPIAVNLRVTVNFVLEREGAGTDADAAEASLATVTFSLPQGTKGS